MKTKKYLRLETSEFDALLKNGYAERYGEEIPVCRNGDGDGYGDGDGNGFAYGYGNGYGNGWNNGTGFFIIEEDESGDDEE